MSKIIPYILIAVLSVSQFFSFREINDLEHQIWSYRNQLNSMQSMINSQIDYVSKSFDEKLEEQSSVIFRANTEFGEFNTDKLTVPVTFTVEPKRVTDETEVLLKFDKETLKLAKKDTFYSITKTFEVTGDEVFPTIIIENDGTQTITQDKDLRIYSLVDEFIPKLFPISPSGGGISTSIYSDFIEYRQSGDLFISGKFDEFENAKYVTYIDGEKAGEIDIVLDLFESGRAILLDYSTFELIPGQILTTSVVALDKLGFTHEYPLERYVVGVENPREPRYEEVKITTEDGRVIFDNTQLV